MDIELMIRIIGETCRNFPGKISAYRCTQTAASKKFQKNIDWHEFVDILEMLVMEGFLIYNGFGRDGENLYRRLE